jgi:single-strand DNA-binding protein
MSGNLNRVELIGNVARDPESRNTSSGTKVVSFSLATNERWKSGGETKERAEFHRIVVFNEHVAKVVEQYVRKGSLIYVSGQLQTRKWTDQQNQERYTTEVVVPAFKGEILLLDRKSDGQDNRGGGYAPPPADDGDSIPFAPEVR